MRSLLAKNIIAHRSRNSLTSNIYALTLGCIIFLIVSANLQIDSIAQLSSIGDADIVIKTKVSDEYGENQIITAPMFEEVLKEHKKDVLDLSYVTI